MYGQLPSYVLENATMFDLMVANALAEYESNLLSGNKPVPDLSQEQMMEMIKNARGDNDKKTTTKSG